MLCVRDDGHEARRIVRNRIANRAHHNFRLPETAPPNNWKVGNSWLALRYEADGNRVDPISLTITSFTASIADTGRMHQENRRAPHAGGRTSHAHTGAQSLLRKRRDLCREGDTAQGLKYQP
jgi:hypothetical protein